MASIPHKIYFSRTKNQSQELVDNEFCISSQTEPLASISSLSKSFETVKEAIMAMLGDFFAETCAGEATGHQIQIETAQLPTLFGANKEFWLLYVVL
ncbi:hypothetical protein SLA2020_175120 [Shorea laevis]